MMFLRIRRGRVENTWMPSHFTAKEKGHALFVLGGAVVVASHPYDRDPHSGSGNCWCGRHRGERIHHVVPTPEVGDRRHQSAARMTDRTIPHGRCEPLPGIFVEDDGEAFRVSRHGPMVWPVTHPAPVGTVCRCACGQNYLVVRPRRAGRYTLLLRRITERKARRCGNTVGARPTERE